MASTAYKRFMDSMVIGFDQWHDGSGYDLEALEDMTPEERDSVEMMLRSRSTDDWRAVEALAAIGTPRAMDTVRANLTARDPIARLEALRKLHAQGEIKDLTPYLATLMEKEADDPSVFTQTLAMIGWHKVVGTTPQLMRRCLRGNGLQSCHCAAMLFYLHGVSKSAFDWDHRPFFLRFNGQGPGEREAVFAELCQRTGLDPSLAG